MLWFLFFAVCLSAVCGHISDNDHTQVHNTNRDILLNVQSLLASLESKHALSVSRITVLEEQQQKQLKSIENLVNERQTDKQWISDLETRRENDLRHINDIEKYLKIAQHQLLEFSKYQNLHKSQIANFVNSQEKDLNRGQLQQKSVHPKASMETHQKNEQQQVFTMKRLFKQIQNQTMDTVLPDKQNDALDYVPVDKRPSLPKQTQVKDQPLKRVTETKPSVIAFCAALSHDIGRVAINMPIQFNQLSLNAGHCYSVNTGVFTCTSPGIYLFTWTVQIASHGIVTDLVRNGGTIAVGYAGDTGYSSVGTSVALVELNQGDEVWVRVLSFNQLPGAGHVIGIAGVTSFSGYQIH